jgi:hypothetical protein
MRRFHTLLALPALLLAACGDPGSSAGAGRFSASLSGAVTARYEGSGEFHTGTPGPGMQQFQITSLGGEAFAGQHFALTRWDGGRLRTGRHDIGLVDLTAYSRTGAQPRGISFQYFRTTGSVEELYVAESGAVEITSSSGDRVAGTFTVTAFRYCIRDRELRDIGPCDYEMSRPTPDAPRITVTGTFVATPFEPGEVIAL